MRKSSPQRVGKSASLFCYAATTLLIILFSLPWHWIRDGFGLMQSGEDGGWGESGGSRWRNAHSSESNMGTRPLRRTAVDSRGRLLSPLRKTRRMVHPRFAGECMIGFTLGRECPHLRIENMGAPALGYGMTGDSRGRSFPPYAERKDGAPRALQASAGIRFRSSRDCPHLKSI